MALRSSMQRPPPVQGTLVGAQPVMQGVVQGLVAAAPSSAASEEDLALRAALAESARVDAEERTARRDKQRRERLEVEVALRSSEGQRAGNWGSPRPVQQGAAASVLAAVAGDSPPDATMSEAMEASRASHERRRRAEAQERVDMNEALRASLEDTAAATAASAVAAPPERAPAGAAAAAPAAPARTSSDPLDAVAAAHNLTAEALREFCGFFDVDPELAPLKLVTAVAKGATADVPDGWREVEDPGSGRTYYVSPTNAVTWSHPMDATTRDTVAALRAAAAAASDTCTALPEPEPELKLEPEAEPVPPPPPPQAVSLPPTEPTTTTTAAEPPASGRPLLVARFEACMVRLEATVETDPTGAGSGATIAALEKEARALMAQIRSSDGDSGDGVMSGVSSALGTTTAAGAASGAVRAAPAPGAVAAGAPVQKVRQRYRVVENATVRAGRDKDTVKVGEYAKGIVIDVVQTSVGKGGDGLYGNVVMSVSSPQGWAKVQTSKGKTLLELIVRAPPQQPGAMTPPASGGGHPCPGGGQRSLDL